MDRNWQSKKDEAFSSWQITFALLRKTKKAVAGYLSIYQSSLNILVRVATLPMKSLQSNPFYEKRELFLDHYDSDGI